MAMSSNVSNAGLATVSQPAGASAGSLRSTMWLRVEFIASDSEYGSVTMLFSTWPVECTYTSTSYR